MASSLPPWPPKETITSPPMCKPGERGKQEKPPEPEPQAATQPDKHPCRRAKPMPLGYVCPYRNNLRCMETVPERCRDFATEQDRPECAASVAMERDEARRRMLMTGLVK